MDLKKETATCSEDLKTMQLNDQKAGMEGLDKDNINKIIYETSKGTPYFTFQEKRQKSINSKVTELLAEMNKITESAKKEFLRKMDILGNNLESKRDLSHSIVHIDMDAFYAAVEMLDNPALKEKPMAVGSSSMLSTSNYLARKYGVRAAMPGFIAKKLCPELVIVPCNFDKYRSVSHMIRKIVEEYDPNYCASSLDEMYLDLTEYIIKKHRKTNHEAYCLKNDICDSIEDDEIASNDCVDSMNCIKCVEPISSDLRDKLAFDIVSEIREKIFDATQLTASAGIAPNTMLAKVCSDQNKPNGQYQIPSSAIAVKSFISTLPVKKVSGIGPVQGQILNAIGIHTCADMWDKRDLVASLFTSNSVDFYMRVALGIGSTTVKSEYTRKSIGNEQTFKEIHQKEELHKKCEELCDDLREDLKSHNMLGKVLVLKIKTTKFETRTRNQSLPYYTADPGVIYSAAKKLLDNEIAAVAPQPLKLRLMGVRMCNLMHEDSVSSNEKQPVTLKNFLQCKTSIDKVDSSLQFDEKFTCPVCLENYNTDFDIFNDHVNDCQSDNLQLEHTRGSCKQESEIDPAVLERTNSSYATVLPDTKNVTYACPVCGSNPGINSLLELNTHIDNCLNKVAIKKILSEDLVQAASKRKTSHSEKSSSKKIKGPGK